MSSENNPENRPAKIFTGLVALNPDRAAEIIQRGLEVVHPSYGRVHMHTIHRKKDGSPVVTIQKGKKQRRVPFDSLKIGPEEMNILIYGQPFSDWIHRLTVRKSE